MTPSSTFTPSWTELNAQSSPDMSQAVVIQQTDLHVAFIPPYVSAFQQSPSPMPCGPSLKTYLTKIVPHPTSNCFIIHPVPTVLVQNHPSGSTSRESSVRRHKSTYPADLTPIPSSLCPLCPARDRLEQWKPLIASRPQHGSNLPLLSSDELSRIEHVVTHAWADSTKETYGSGLLIYHVFCDSKHIPDAHAPASSILISSFLSNLAGFYSSATVSNYLQGVRAWHIIHGLDWTIKDDKVNALLKAAATLTTPSSKCKPREPYTIDTIATIHRSLDLDTPLHATVFACLTTIFYATARVGEFTVPKLDAFDPLKHVKLQDMRRESDRNGREITNFHLPRTKAAPQGEDVNWARQNGPSDPEFALDNHLRVNNPLPESPLFAYRDGPKGILKPLTRNKFISTLSLAAKATGIKPLSGHSLCIGSTLEYLLHNILFDVVKVKGRWASDAFLLYLHHHAQILAPYMQATLELHKSFLRYTMPPVHG